MNDMMIILVVAIVTLMTRALPFLVFSNNRNVIVEYLGKVLPYSIMAMLVVYCLKDVQFLSGNYGISEMLAVLTVIFLHVYKRNTLLSIIGGTFVYMIFVQFIFV